MNAQVNAEGKLTLGQAELDYLDALRKAGDRAGFYMAYYNMTGNDQAALQAQISSFSEGNGGAAYAANFLLQSHFGPQGRYLGLYRISQLVAESALAAIKSNINNGGDGIITETEMLISAGQAWNRINQGDLFPGNLLEWPARAFQLGVPQPDEATLWQNLVDLCESVSDQELLREELLTTGTLTALLGTTVGPRLFGKRHSDYANNPDYAIRETPDGEWEVVVRISDGKTVAVFDDDLIPDSITDFLGALANFGSSVVTAALTPFLFPIESALSQLRRSLTEGTPGFDGEVYAHESNPPFTANTNHLHDDPTSGNDTLWGSDGLGGIILADDEIDGGAGNDVIFGGDGDDILRGGDNNDILYGNDDDDTLHGDAGDDVLRGGDGEDALFGGADSDILDTGDAPVAIMPHDLSIESATEHAHGGAGDDLLRGGAGSQRLWGDDGNDTICGGADADYVEGGDGNDFIDGGSGWDFILAGAGDDVIVPGPGGPVPVQGNSVDTYGGDDFVYARNGEADFIWNNGGVDDLFIDHMDTVAIFREGYAEWAGATIGARFHYRGTVIDFSGMLGNVPRWLDSNNPTESVDSLKIYETADGAYEFWALVSPDGVYAIRGMPSGDEPVGATYYMDSWNGYSYFGVLPVSGNPVIGVGENVPLFQGEAGTSNGILAGTAGDDELTANPGSSWVIEAGAGNDLLTGASLRDVLSGGDGDDQLYGVDGDDRLRGEAGTDVLDGGAGNDALWGDADSDVLNGGDDDDQLHGGAQTDSLFGDAGDDTLHGDGGNDELNGGDGEDTLYGGDGEDELNGGTDTDILLGDAGDDILVGGYEYDELYGGAGNDQLNGNEDDDFLMGDAGNDLLSGDEGYDYIEGGLGNDVYLFALGDEEDFIYEDDSSSDADVIRFGAGITPEQIIVSSRWGDRTFSIAETDDSITVIDWYASGNARRVDRIEFADGTIWHADDIVDSDQMGNGAYVGGQASDIAMISGEAAADVTRSSAAHTLAAQVELLFSTGSAPVNGVVDGSASALLNDMTAANGQRRGAIHDLSIGADGNASRWRSTGRDMWASTHALLAQHLDSADSEASGAELAGQYGHFRNHSNLSSLPDPAGFGPDNFQRNVPFLHSSRVRNHLSVDFS